MTNSRLLSVIAAGLLTAAVGAQDSFAELRAQLDRERHEFLEKADGRPSFEAVRELAARHIGLVEKWLPDAAGADAVNGRLLLADILLNTGQEKRARDVLGAIDPQTAPPLALAAAAEMAGMLGMRAERDAWIDAAVDQPAAFEDRMSLAMFLMTRLVEIEKGEAIFDAALEAAKDDEQRAQVLWYRAAAIREREDLAEGAYESALEALAKEYPDTYWGGIARDRRAAFDFAPGVPAIPFVAKTLSGDEVRLSDFAGKVLLLDFWSAQRSGGSPVHDEVARLAADYGERGLVVVGVALDEDRAAVERAVTAQGRKGPQVFDGRGFRTDLALRYGIETVPDHVLIGRDGKIAAIRLFLQDPDGVAELRAAIERALGSDDGGTGR